MYVSLAGLQGLSEVTGDYYWGLQAHFTLPSTPTSLAVYPRKGFVRPGSSPVLLSLLGHSSDEI